MPDFMRAEMRVAYASAPAGVVILHTVEITHLDFTEPVRLVGNSETDITATLEATAPIDAGQAVVFTALPFVFIEPGVDDDGQATPAKVRIDNVSGRIASLIKLTRGSDAPVDLIYRSFRSDGLTVPGQVYRGLEMRRVKIRARTAEADIGWPDIENQNFPAATYGEEYPGLMQL